MFGFGASSSREPDLSFIQADVDLSQVRSLDSKPVINAVNEFMARLADRLNTFGEALESRMGSIEDRLLQAEVQLALLETNVHSVEECPDEPTPAPADSPKAPEPPAPEAATVEVTDQPVTVAAPPPATGEPTPASPPEEPQKPVVTYSQHPAFAKYFKMLRLGIPQAAVCQKMRQEGVDPAILETPSAPCDLPIEEHEDEDSDE